MKNLTNKNIIFCDDHGNFSLHSSEEVIASKLNNWKGWKCSAGINSLYVTADGNVYNGTCKVEGLKGNVYDTGVVFPSSWTVCTNDFCTNRFETQLFKSKHHNPLVGHDDLKNFSASQVDPAWVGPSNVDKNFPLTITWDIGRRCNYKCSYCAPSVSNTYEVNKTLGSLKFAIRNLHEDYCQGKKAIWNFSGGEPTINPSYMEIVKHLYNDLGHSIITQTNASQGESYYSELIEYSSIFFSAHLDQYNEEQFIKNTQAVIEKISTIQEPARKQFFVKVMTPPGKVKEGQDLIDKLKRLPNAGLVTFMKLAMIHHQSAEPYTSEEVMAFKKT